MSILLYMATVINAQTIIAALTGPEGGVYDDNAHMASGWTIFGGGGDAYQPPSGVTYEPNTGVYFIGPFSGSYDGSIDNQFYIEQSFECSKASEFVNVEYILYVCGDLENSDEFKLAINGVSQAEAERRGALQDDLSNWDQQLTFYQREQINNISQCFNGSTPQNFNWGWLSMTIGYQTNGIFDVAANTPFTVSFYIAISANNEWAAISNVKIRCMAEPDSSPAYVLYALASVVALLFILAIFAFLFNKRKFPKLPGFNVVDDAEWTALMIYSLQLWCDAIFIYYICFDLINVYNLTVIQGFF